MRFPVWYERSPAPLTKCPWPDQTLEIHRDALELTDRSRQNGRTPSAPTEHVIHDDDIVDGHRLRL